MRILYTGDADSVHVQRWLHEMNARGIECHLLTRRPGVVPAAASVHVLQQGSDAAGWFRAIPQVRRLARRLRPDLVHGHYISSNGLWAAASGVAPVVLTAWGSDILVTPRTSRLMRALTGWTLRRASLLTGDSADLVDAMKAYHPRAACHEISWGADTGRFVPPPAPRPATPLHLLSLRAWEPNYNIDTLVDAVARLRGERPDVQLWLLGGGTLEPALRQQVDRLGLATHVHFVGRQGDAGMLDALQRCSISLSVPSSDATSVSLLESMACGLALIATDLPANRQWITEAGGALVPARDADVLAAALRKLAADAPRVATMGAHNHAIALQRASRQVQMDRMVTLYRGLLA